MDKNTSLDLKLLYKIKAEIMYGVDVNSNLPNKEREDSIKELTKQNNNNGGNNDDDDNCNKSPPPTNKSAKIKGCFTVLTESDIKKLQLTEINNVSSVLNVPKYEASLLLIHYGWSAIMVHEAWFDDEAKARELTGLVHFNNNNNIINPTESITCKICFDTFSYKKVKFVKCGHVFCTDRWSFYVDTKIQDGPSQCLKLKCPAFSCNAAVDGEMIRRFASESSRIKYDQFVLRSFVEGSKTKKWCPSPGCDFAVVYEADGVDRRFIEATCLCYHRFCWKCGEEAHTPVSCEGVRDWVAKNETESKSTLWIFDYTKPCPGCKQPIEKQGGCSFITCTICSFHFCWLCLRSMLDCTRFGRCTTTYIVGGGEEEIMVTLPPPTPRWEGDHDSYEEIKELEVMETRRRKTKIYKYTHYYERWATNEFSMKKAIEILVSRINNARNIKTMCENYKIYNEDAFEFLRLGWEKIVECRRVLKWTYAYGYLISQHEEAKKEFLEYYQSVAENSLEKLHQYAESVLKVLLGGGTRKYDLSKIRCKMVNLTHVTNRFFENMVKALEENKLEEVKVKKYAGMKHEIDNDDNERWKCPNCGEFMDSTSEKCPCRRSSNKKPLLTMEILTLFE